MKKKSSKQLWQIKQIIQFDDKNSESNNYSINNELKKSRERTGKYNKSFEGAWKRAHTFATKIPKITNQGKDTGKYNKPLNEFRQRAFTNVTKIPKTTLMLDYCSF